MVLGYGHVKVLASDLGFVFANGSSALFMPWVPVCVASPLFRLWKMNEKLQPSVGKPKLFIVWCLIRILVPCLCKLAPPFL